MKIKEISEKTGISKRNIHFYIEEGLLTPSIDEENGYYNFSNEDIMLLLLIKNLRELDLPLSSIKALLSAPESAMIYFKKLRSTKINQLELINRQLEHINTIINSLPLHPDKEFLNSLEQSNFEDIHNLTIPYDQDVVNHFLFRYFVDEDLSEYQKFLLSRLHIITEDQELNFHNVKFFNNLISYSDEQIRKFYSTRKNHYNIILETNDKIDIIEQYKKYISDFSHCHAAIDFWNKYYESSIIHEVAIYANPKINELMRELSPTYAKFQDTIFPILFDLKEWLLTPGNEVYALLKKKLKNNFDIEYFNHAQISFIVSCYLYFIE